MKKNKQKYGVTGMHCGACAEAIRLEVAKLKGVSGVEVSFGKSSLELEAFRIVSVGELNKLVKKIDKNYAVVEFDSQLAVSETDQGLVKYLPVAVIVLFSLAVGYTAKLWSGEGWEMFMHIYMGTFFAIFGAFKVANLSGFVSMFASYDLIAKRFASWGYVFAFLELVLAFMYLTGSYITVANVVTAVVMLVASLGVLRAVLNKNRIVCACLGGIFSFPVSWVTFLEDFSMALMAVGMIVWMLVSGGSGHGHY